MRRPAPRPVAHALDDYARDAAPKTPLAAVQGLWPEVAGEVITAQSRPVSERFGTVEFECASAVWANELELLEGDLRDRLNTALARQGASPIKVLRFRPAAPSGAIS